MDMITCNPATISTFYPVLHTLRDDPAFVGLDLAGIVARMGRLPRIIRGSQTLRPCTDPACREWALTEQRPTRWTHYHDDPAERVTRFGSFLSCNA